MEGTTKTITWQSEGSISDVNIEYSSNEGGVWVEVDPQNVGNNLTYDWTVPQITSNKCLVRITNVADANVTDVSDKVFTIYVCTMVADLTGDCCVDWFDMYELAEEWLTSSGEGLIDFMDYAVLADEWLRCTNIAPRVNAGEDESINLTDGNSVSLDGTVIDDGLPDPPADVTTLWEQKSGSGTVIFGNPNDIDTTATFTEADTYILRLTADDGELSDYDEMTVVVTSLVNGLNYEYYEGDWEQLPDFDLLTPLEVGTVNNFDISGAAAEDYFGYRFTGYIDIATEGTYTFYTSSDDGSQLFIGETLVVDNDGQHAPQEVSGIIYLTVGKHEIEVTYFEWIVGQVLTVSYEGPGVAKTQIPDGVLYR
jgi:hypothetical protein